MTMLLAATTLLLAVHGGTYRAVLPPPPLDGRLPRNPSPSAPGSAGPTTGGKAGPSAPGPGAPPGPMTPGDEVQVDVLSWRHWWGLSSDRLLGTKAHIHAGKAATSSDTFYLGRGERKAPPADHRPDLKQLGDEIRPALQAELAEESVDRRTAALIALGKIGAREEQASALLALLTPHLASANQEVCESAALAIGLTGLSLSEQTLLDLALDRSRGRTLTRSSSVSTRTRAFAVYGLGLLGHSNREPRLRQRIVEALIGLALDQTHSSQDLPVAAISAIGLIPLSSQPLIPRLDSGRRPGPNAPLALSLRTQVEWLAELVAPQSRRQASGVNWLVRAHGARSLARLAASGPTGVKRHATQALTRCLEYSREPEPLHQSAALALGLVADSDGEQADKEARKALLDCLAKGQPQVRRYALIALARIGSRSGEGPSPDEGLKETRGALLSTLARGKSQLKPWAGLALGVMGWQLAAHGREPNEDASAALRAAFSQSKSPASTGAYALALGLRKDTRALSSLETRLARTKDPLVVGDLALAIGLLGEAHASGAIRPLLEGSRYRPLVLNKLATAMALLRDDRVVPDLVGLLASSNSSASRAAIAASLGTAGDRRAVAPLLNLLEDPSSTGGARAFAAVALGAIADPRPLPWSNPYAEDANFRCFLPTQFGGGTGLLEIL